VPAILGSQHPHGLNQRPQIQEHDMRQASLFFGAALCALAAAAGATTAHSNWGFDVAGMDKNVVPGNNFYDYANGNNVKNLVIPPDQSRTGAFVDLRNLSEARTHKILEDAQAKLPATPVQPIDKAAAFYKAFMDEAAVEKLGAQPLKTDLDLIRAVNSHDDFARLNGLAPSTFLGSLFDLSIAPDAKDPTRYAINVGQSGLGMPDRDYYLSADFADKRAQYSGFVEKLLTLAGWPNAKLDAAAVVAFETQIAQVSWSKSDQRDDDKSYNPVSLPDLVHAAPGFNWAVFFKSAGLGSPDRVILNENTGIAKIAELAGKTPVSTLCAWAAFHLALNASPDLSRDFVTTHFDFINKSLQGQPQERPRWKRAVAATQDALGEAIGEAYVARYFPPVARTQMDALTHDLRDAFHARLEHNDWMSSQTRAKALEKLGTFDFQIGYPKKWRDYSALTVSVTDLYGNTERATAFEWNFWLSHLGKPVDRDLWEMYPQTVNAYNEPLLNEVVFPAAILQPPFFNPEADPAINYGGIGGVIGHEMTHSFDDQGRKHDAQGRLTDWWTADDVKRFEARAKKFGAEFGAMQVPGGHINPDLTMGENIADLGGLTLALDAYHASLHGKPAPLVGGFTGDQRVFLGWAQVWRAKQREAVEKQLLTIDPHSPPIARVNGPVRNIDAWYAAFAVKPGQTLYLDPQARVKIW
jgi:putative endopeptidase